MLSSLARLDKIKPHIQPCTSCEAGAWVDFLNKNFRYTPPQSYAVDFAPLFEVEALKNSRLVWVEDRIVSSATLYKVVAVAPGKSFKIGIIGAVATDEAYRGRGYSKIVLAELEKLARLENLDGLVLWSDKTEFYKSLGFVPQGYQQIYSLKELPAPEVLPKGSAVIGWSWEKISHLYKQHALRLERSLAHWDALRKIKSCCLLQWQTDDEEVLAYIGFDRGKDLQNIVHEWGGGADALHALLWVALQSRPELMWLTHSKLDDPIKAYLPATGLIQEGYLALFKPLRAGAHIDDLWFWGMDSV